MHIRFYDIQLLLILGDVFFKNLKSAHIPKVKLYLYPSFCLKYCCFPHILLLTKALLPINGILCRKKKLLGLLFNIAYLVVTLHLEKVVIVSKG